MMAGYTVRKKGRVLIPVVLFAMMPTVLAVVMLFTYVNYTLVTQEPRVEIIPDNNYDTTIIAVADIELDPFSYINEYGMPAGYDVELLFAIANHMRVNVSLRLMHRDDCMAAIDSGDAHVIMGVHYSRHDYENLLQTTVIANDRLVCIGREDFSGINHLFNSTVAIFANDESVINFIESYKLAGGLRYYDSYTKAAESVLAGSNDYAIVRSAVGNRILTRLEDRELQVVGPILADNLLCYGVNANNPELLAHFDSAIEELHSDGTIDMLTEKWLGLYVEVMGFGDLIKHYYTEFTIGGAVAFVVILTMAVYFYRTGLLIEKAQAGLEKKELLAKVHYDALTRIRNRRYLDETLDNLLGLLSRMNGSICIFMIDIDYFKQYNDTYGHQKGDECLKIIAETLNSALSRESDYVARYGGEEFIAVLPNVDERGARIMAEKMLESVRSLLIPHLSSSVAEHVTVSLGVATGKVLHKRSSGEYIEQADKALYMAKQSGRNRYVHTSMNAK